MAEGGGVEPPTTELTVPCSTSELPSSKKCGRWDLNPQRADFKSDASADFATPAKNGTDWT